MMAKGRQGHRIDPDIEAEIRQLVPGFSAVQIKKHLEEAKDKNGQLRFAYRIPDIRTIRKRVRDNTAEDTSGRWRFAQASGGAAALILPVLGAVMERTLGQVSYFTKDQAKWVLKVRRAAPDLDAWYVWRAATAYQFAAQKGTEADRESLDALLAFAPWRSQDATRDFLAWVGYCRPAWFSWDVHTVPMPAGMHVAMDIEARWPLQPGDVDHHMDMVLIHRLGTAAKGRTDGATLPSPAGVEEKSNESPGKS